MITSQAQKQTQAADNFTQVVSENCHGDTPKDIDTFPSATGQEIRKMLSRFGISDKEAAAVLGMSTRYVRARKRLGTLTGKETWTFLCFLPQRYSTMTSLNDSSAWRRSRSNRHS